MALISEKIQRIIEVLLYESSDCLQLALDHLRVILISYLVFEQDFS